MTGTELAALLAIVAIALAFDFTNGFHDAANAIATSVSTRALTPRVALVLSAIMNFAGAFISTKVAATVGGGLIDSPEGTHGLVIVFGALMGAILWNLITWSLGLPSSSSHALFGGLVGASLAASNGVKWAGIIEKVIIPMILSPIAGVILAYLFMTSILWVFHRSHHGRVSRGFRSAQTVSAAAMALGHGLQDAQKTMGVIVLALVTVGVQDNFDVPFWVVVISATALGFGTYAGGWRIIRTLGRRIVHLDPPSGFTAETTAASILYTTAYVFAAPISTTHTITSAVLGAGAAKRPSAVRWGVAGNILMAWVLTFPGAAAIAAVSYWVVHAIVRA